MGWPVGWFIYKNGGVLENTCCGIMRYLLIVMRWIYITSSNNCDEMVFITSLHDATYVEMILSILGFIQRTVPWWYRNMDKFWRVAFFCEVWSLDSKAMHLEFWNIIKSCSNLIFEISYPTERLKSFCEFFTII